MKRTICLLVGLGFLLLSPVRASAFTFERVQSSSGKWYPARWSQSTTAVHFVLNNTPLDLLPNFTSASTPMAAVQAAMQTWAIGPPPMMLDGTVDQSNGGKDGVNLITFADTPQNRDAVGDANAVTLYWIKNTKPVSQPYWTFQEADIIVSPKKQWDTNGDPNSIDLQSSLTHEMGHVLGLDHSPVLGATMFSGGSPGLTHRRILEADDIAGMRALYDVSIPDDGALAGMVVGGDGKPVFGAGVVALDPNGTVPAAVLTEKDGSFQLPSLPPGQYAVYVEPLVGAFTRASQLPDPYYDGLRTDFRTRFAGDASTPPYRVTAGATTTIDPITVDTRPPTLIPQFIAASSDGNPSNVYGGPMVVPAGSSGYLTVVGPGLDAATEIGVTGSDITLDPGNAAVGNWNTGTYYVTVPFTVSSTASRAVHTLLLASDNEIAAYTGGLKVIVP